jgi:hypothetical protein
MPLGIGKPNPFVNALYQPHPDPARRLTIVTALSLEAGRQERPGAHFLAPLVERVFADYPDLDYVKDLRGPAAAQHRGARVLHEDRRLPAATPVAQQGYISTNYTFVARDMGVQGMNVIAQAVAAQRHGDAWQLSLSQQPGRGVRGGGTLCRAGQAAAEGGRGQPADALHAQRRGGGAGLLRHRGDRPGRPRTPCSARPTAR